MGDSSSFDRSKVLTFLSPETTTGVKTEEESHPWCTTFSQTLDMPLLRIWDYISGSKPDERGNMESRAPDQRLDTFETRKSTLTTHLNHADWTPTPYISFTVSPGAVEKLEDLRVHHKRRGSQTLTVIDPKIRLKLGFPILDVAAEMDHYDILDPYEKSGEYYKDHYICLWRVTEREIIGHWPCDDLFADKKWYQETIWPAFREYHKNAMPRSARNESSDLSTALGKLSISSDAAHLPAADKDTSGEEEVSFASDQSSYDTDDEVEETNAADDMMKVIEGD